MLAPLGATIRETLAFLWSSPSAGLAEFLDQVSPPALKGCVLGGAKWAGCKARRTGTRVDQREGNGSP